MSGLFRSINIDEECIQQRKKLLLGLASFLGMRASHAIKKQSTGL